MLFTKIGAACSQRKTLDPGFRRDDVLELLGSTVLNPLSSSTFLALLNITIPVVGMTSLELSIHKAIPVT